MVIMMRTIHNLKRFFAIILMAALLLVSVGICLGQEGALYPRKPVTVIVPYPPGGGADVAARLLSQYFSKKWGKSINVTNVTGGGGLIGAKSALESAPDGYTLLLDTHTSAAMAPAVYEKLPYDWKKRTWIGCIFAVPSFYLVNASSPYRNLSDVAKAVKENPQKFSWGGTGRSGTATFVLGQFFDTIGVKIDETNMVELQGNAPAITALAGGHIHFACGQSREFLPLMSAGKIRALAVVDKDRAKELPEIPTVAEVGYPTLDVKGFNGIVGPEGLPSYVVDKWANGLKEASTDPEFLSLAEKTGANVSYLGPKEYNAFAMKQFERYLNLAMKMGIRH